MSIWDDYTSGHITRACLICLAALQHSWIDAAWFIPRVLHSQSFLYRVRCSVEMDVLALILPSLCLAVLLFIFSLNYCSKIKSAMTKTECHTTQGISSRKENYTRHEKCSDQLNREHQGAMNKCKSSLSTWNHKVACFSIKCEIMQIAMWWSPLSLGWSGGC